MVVSDVYSVCGVCVCEKNRDERVVDPRIRGKNDDCCCEGRAKLFSLQDRCNVCASEIKRTQLSVM